MEDLQAAARDVLGERLRPGDRGDQVAIAADDKRRGSDRSGRRPEGLRQPAGEGRGEVFLRGDTDLVERCGYRFAVRLQRPGDDVLDLLRGVWLGKDGRRPALGEPLPVVPERMTVVELEALGGVEPAVERR
jgi:hypothetical protein